MYHHTKFSLSGNLAPGKCAVLSVAFSAQAVILDLCKRASIADEWGSFLSPYLRQSDYMLTPTCSYKAFWSKLLQLA